MFGLCFHKWNAWKEICRFDIIKIYSEKKVGVLIYQERNCEKCNKIQGNTVSTYFMF